MPKPQKKPAPKSKPKSPKQKPKKLKARPELEETEGAKLAKAAPVEVDTGSEHDEDYPEPEDDLSEM